MSITWESIAQERAALINAAVKVPGCENPVTYDPTEELNYGSWICTLCNVQAYGGEDFHQGTCLLRGHQKKWSHPSVIYVIGPNDDGHSAPFPQDRIEEIKALAKANLPSS